MFVFYVNLLQIIYLVLLFKLTILVFKLVCVLAVCVTIGIFQINLPFNQCFFFFLFHLFLVLLLLSFLLSICMMIPFYLHHWLIFFPLNFFIVVLGFITFLINYRLCLHNIILLHTQYEDLIMLYFHFSLPMLWDVVIILISHML